MSESGQPIDPASVVHTMSDMEHNTTLSLRIPTSLKDRLIALAEAMEKDLGVRVTWSEAGRRAMEHGLPTLEVKHKPKSRRKKK